MHWEVLRPSRASTLCLVLLIFSLLLMSLRLTRPVHAVRTLLFYWVSPLQSTAGNLMGETRGLSRRVWELISAHQENILLKGTIRDLSLIEDQYRDVFFENQRLRKILEMKETGQFDIIAAAVSGRDTQGLHQTVWIDRGSVNGVTPDAPVLAVSGDFGEEAVRIGVVGRVLECSARSSKVLLISDPLSSVSISLFQSNEYGLLTGHGPSSLSIDYLDPKADIKKGDDVVTSGLGGIFPPGLAVGKVSHANTTPAGFVQAELVPAVPLSRIREVLVLKKKAVD